MISLNGHRWTPLIAEAQQWKPGEPLEKIGEVREWIRFTLTYCLE